MAQVAPNIMRSPNQLVRKPFIPAKAASDDDAAKNQPTTKMLIAKTAIPVIRTKIEDIDVNCGR